MRPSHQILPRSPPGNYLSTQTQVSGTSKQSILSSDNLFLFLENEYTHTDSNKIIKVAQTVYTHHPLLGTVSVIYMVPSLCLRHRLLLVSSFSRLEVIMIHGLSSLQGWIQHFERVGVVVCVSFLSLLQSVGVVCKTKHSHVYFKGTLEKCYHYA